MGSIPRLSTLVRYIGLFAIVVYLLSFGTFLTRMMSLDSDSAADAAQGRVTLPASSEPGSDRTMRIFANQPNEPEVVASRSPMTPLASPEVPRSSTQQPQPPQSVPKTDRRPDQAPPSRDSPGTSGEKNAQPEVVDYHPEEKLLRQFERQGNATRNNSGDVVVVGVNPASNVTPDAARGFTLGGTVVNPHPFEYLINSKTQCEGSAAPFLFVYVHTAPDHVKRRMVIRQTWGDVRQYSDLIRVVFFTGKPSSAGLQKALLFEAEQYDDIVQEDFLDTYRNLTYKGIAALKWISTYCRGGKFVLKTDDDIFVNMFTLLRHLKRIDNQRGGTVNHLLMCLVWYNMPVMRTGKWKVDPEEWKEDKYPTYCSGSAFVMSKDVALDLHSVSYHVPFFWVDDFYITGLLPQKLGNIEHMQFISAYVLNGLTLEEKFTGTQWYKYIFSHVHNLDAIQFVWRKVIALNKGELHPTIQFLVPSPTTPPH